jgi:ectoine hydroxylase-related dioxygenase (phytanoyl-CoA dioxygenase family)
MFVASARTATALTPEQLTRYQEDGFIVLRNVFSSDEIKTLDDEANALWWRKDLIDKDNMRCRWKNHVETGECTFECFDPVIDISPLCKQFALEPRILAPLADIYGEPACLFKDKLIFKPPMTEGYNMHQDYIAWDSFPRSFVTVLIAIDGAGDDNGATECFPGYHQNGSLVPEDGMYHDTPLELIDLSRGVRLSLKPGDIAIFGGFTPHRSAANLTSGWRRQLYVSYNALSDGGEQRDRHYADFKAWLKDRYAEYGKTQVYFQ